MKTSDKGIGLIKKYEGLRLKAYLCPAKVWTIGYGHTGGVKSGDVVSEAQAEALLRTDLVKFEKVVSSSGLLLNQNQFDALVSFTYNVGAGNFANSTLFRTIKQNPSDKKIREEFLRWVYAAGKMLPGLKSRRIDESNLYFQQ